MVKCYVYYEGDPTQSALVRFIDIFRYSFAPYGGKLLVNDPQPEAMHGAVGDLRHKMLVEFPHRNAAERWYHSALFGLLLQQSRIWPDGNLVLMNAVA